MSDPDTTTAIANATGEVAKASVTALETAQKVGGFISKYIDGPMTQAMAIWEDKLKYSRWERQVRLFQRADQLMQENGISGPTRAIPLKFAVPLLESASLEDDDSLQDMWARLLINAADDQCDIALSRMLISILETLTPLQAKILNCIETTPYDEDKFLGWVTTDLPERVSPKLSTSDMPKLPPDNVVLAIADLVRLGCLKAAVTYGGGDTMAVVYPTVLGKHFFRACTLRPR